MATDSAYRRLAERLATEIATGVYGLGDRLPTEADLCDETGLSRGTVRQALKEIEMLGMISRKPRDGSRVVALHPVEDYRPLADSADDLITVVQRTKIIHPVTRDLVANAALAQRLGVARGSRWQLLEGPRVYRDRREPPLCWSEQYLSSANGESALEVLRLGRFTAEDTRATDIEQIITATILTEDMMAKLETTSAAGLVVTRRHTNSKGRLMAVGIHTHPADRFEVKTTIHRTQ